MQLGPVGVGIFLGGVGSGQGEGVVAELLRRLSEFGGADGLAHGRVGIIGAAGPFEGVAAFTRAVCHLACCTGGAADSLVEIEMGFKLVIGDAPILHIQIIGNEVGTISVFVMAAHFEVRRQGPPKLAIPVDARAAKPHTGQERPEPAHRQRLLAGVVAEGQGLFAGVDHMRVVHRIFQFVMFLGGGKIIGVVAIGSAFQHHTAFAGMGKFICSCQTRPTGPDDDHICFCQPPCHDLPF